MIHQTVLLQRVEKIYYIRNWLIAKIDYDQYHCSDCSQSLCLKIKNKKNLYINYIILSKHLTRTMRISINVAEFQLISSANWLIFFVIIDEKASTNIPWSKMDRLKKNATLTCVYGPMYLQLDDYPPYSGKNQTFLRHILTATWYFLWIY